MDEECLKLTAYFGERQRVDGRFVAETMLSLYEQRRVATSIVLRGIAGFGARHQFRSDQSLTLSEDPPVAVVAVDTRPVIEELFESVLAVAKSGLISLERARLLRDDMHRIEVSDEHHEATKLTIYVGRKERVYGVPAYLAVCDLLYRRQLAGASVFMGVDGTVRGNRERARFFDRNTNVPMMIIAVGSGERISRVLPELGGLLHRPLVTVERVRVCKRDGQLLERPPALPGTDGQGLAHWQKLMVYSSESARGEGMPIHRALIQRLRQHEPSQGATVLRGIWGFHGDHAPHGDKFFTLSRNVPVVTIIVDTPHNIAASFDIVDEITGEQGLVTSEMVPAVAIDGIDGIDGDDGSGGARLARHRY